MKNLSIEQLKTLVIASLLMIIGILFCCSLSMGMNGLSMVLGFVLMIIGIIFIANSLVTRKELFSTNGILGMLILTLGLLFMLHNLAGIVFIFIPWLLIVFGLATIINVFIGKFIRLNDNKIEFIVKLIVGIVFLTLGICLKTIKNFSEYSSLICGVLMILYSIYFIFVAFTKTEVTIKSIHEKP